MAVLITRGHVQHLLRGRKVMPFIGLNSDASVLGLKVLPINTESDRAASCALRAVDELSSLRGRPRALIEAILPHILVRSRWAHYVSGRDIVEAHGGRVILAEFSAGHSTTNTIERILRAEAV